MYRQMRIGKENVFYEQNRDFQKSDEAIVPVMLSGLFCELSDEAELCGLHGGNPGGASNQQKHCRFAGYSELFQLWSGADCMWDPRRQIPAPENDFDRDNRFYAL